MPQAVQNLLYKGCSHVEPAFSECLGSRFAQEPGESWSFTWELVRAREGGKLGWDLEKGEILRHYEQRDWAWKMVWVREVGSGSQAGTDCGEGDCV